MTMNGAVLPVMALYIVAAQEQGVRTEAAERDDPERHLEGVHGPEHVHLSAGPKSLRIISAIFSRSRAAKMPKFNSISMSAATTCRRRARRRIMELAYTLADGLEYVRTGVAAGLEVDAFCPRMSFFFGIGMHF
jgi:methylmalonyl-CoA mutase